jgi:hypothetical protein
MRRVREQPHAIAGKEENVFLLQGHAWLTVVAPIVAAVAAAAAAAHAGRGGCMLTAEVALQIAGPQEGSRAMRTGVQLLLSVSPLVCLPPPSPAVGEERQEKDMSSAGRGSTLRSLERKKRLWQPGQVHASGGRLSVWWRSWTRRSEARLNSASQPLMLQRNRWRSSLCSFSCRSRLRF